MFECFVGAVLLTLAIGGVILGIFALKHHYDEDLVDYKEQKFLENQLTLINQLPEITAKLMDNLKDGLKEWMEDLKDIM